MELKEGDLVLCTVRKITKTSIFVDIEDNGEGTIITSEIAPGRIRNIREYVVPNKKIVCKVLRVSGRHIDLSLRRVSTKEKKEVLERKQREKSSETILKTILKEKTDSILEKLRKQGRIYDYLQEAKENPKLLESLMSKSEAEKILKILKEKKEKNISVKKEFFLKSLESNGITIVKNILSPLEEENCKISYISAGKFLIKIKGKDYKKANSQLNKKLEKIEEESKKQSVEFELKEK